jgi:hypothetical protein
MLLSCSPHPVYHVSTLPDLPAAGSPHHASFTCGRFIVSSDLLDVAALHQASGTARQRAAGSPRRRLLTPPASPVAGSPHPPNWSRSTHAHHPKALRGRGKGQGRRVLSRRTGTFMADAVVCKLVGGQNGPKKALTKILAETNGPNHGNVSSFIIRYRLDDMDQLLRPNQFNVVHQPIKKHIRSL